MTRKKTLIEQAYEQLRESLLSCRVMPEARLKITELAAEFAVSPGAVREALSRLHSENLVVFEPMKGYRAAPLSCAASTDLLNARIEVETACFRHSVKDGDARWYAEVSSAHARLVALAGQEEAVACSDAWRETEREFLNALVAGCRNRTLLQIRANLLEQSQRYLNLAWRLAPERRRLGIEHQALVEAAMARDPDRCARAISDHILLTRQWILAAMTSDAWVASVAPHGREGALTPARSRRERERRQVAA